MSSGTLGLTMKDLEARVSYPLRKAKVHRLPPLSTHDSRTALAMYRQAMDGNREGTFRMGTTKRASGDVTEPLMAKFRSAMDAEQYPAALAALLEAERLGRVTHDVFYNVGLLQHNDGAHDVALQYFTKAVAVDPMHSDGYLRRAECYVALDCPAEAFAEFEKHFKLSPPDKVLLVKCGKCALDAGDDTAAEQYLLAALAHADVDPTNDAYAYFNLGELEERRGADPRAQEYYAKVCACDAGFPDPYVVQAEAEFEAGNFPVSLQLFEAVAKMVPDRPDVHVRIGDVYCELGPEFAPSVLSCLTRAAELGTDGEAQERTLVRRGVLLYTEFDDCPQALADFTKCLALNPHNVDALLHRAMAYRTRSDVLGDWELAVEDYAVLVALPEVPWAIKAEPFRVLGRDEANRGRFAEAAAHYSFAVVSGAELDREDEHLMRAALAHAHGAAPVPTPDVLYEQRLGHAPREPEGKKAKAADPALLRGPQIAPLHQSMLNDAFTALRTREPTAHSSVEYELIAAWQPRFDEAERLRLEAEGGKAGKKGSKKK